MAFCPSCGAAVEGRYCAKCGTAVDPGAAPVATAPAVSASGLPENTAAALCYLLGLVTGIIFLVLEPYSKNKLIRFHAFQSIFLHVAVIIVWVVFRTILPWSLWFVITLVDLGFFVLWIFLLIQTYQGKKIMLPVIGDLASKQAG
ncbi:MAG TPA: hypothetical protein VKR61_10825 [Bryobacteraceae bacterium]|nr:hypothetical protein [Bryobacteraceae bacterium]